MGKKYAGKVLYSQIIVGIAAFAALASGAGTAEAVSFLNSCTTYCHGMPPRDGARKSNPHFNSLSSSFVGNHKNHLPAAPTTNDCSVCHSPVAPTDFGHQNKVINMANSLKGYSSAALRAKYDKGVFFNQTSIPILTNATCSNVNCHFEKTTPVWGSAAFNPATDCNACHGAPPTGTVGTPTGGLAGSHTRHDVYFPGTTNCQKCHPNSTGFTHATSAGRALKVQGFLRDPLNTLESTGTYTGTGLNYLPSKSAAPGFGTCSNLYCHSTAQSATGSGVGTTVITPAWGSAALNCASCHVDMSSSASATGSHAAHAQSSGTAYTCDVCHGTGYGAATVNVATHVNKQINLSFTGNAAGTTYTTKGTAFTPGSAVYSTCTTSNCHGAMTPTWGANTAKARCQKCHGYRSTAWNGLNGATATTDTKVGTHFNHISSSGTIKYSKPLSCAECHAASIALPTDNVNAAGHFDSAGPAEVSFGALAKTNASAATYAAPTCASNYCHGSNMTSNLSNPPASRVASPNWNAAFLGTASVVGNGNTTPGSGDCAKCHGYPPMTATHAGKLATDCTGCHSHVNASGTGFIDASKHINGVVDGGGVSSGGSPCYGCHSAYNVMNSSTSFFHHVLDAVAPDQAPNTGTYPSSQSVLACVSCHTDHNYTNTNKGSNLRSAYNAAAGGRDNHDFSPTSPYGLCVSCHSTAQTKSTAQTVAGTVATIVIDGSATGFQASMHNYTASSLFGTSQFSANCVKCHTDEQAKDKQTSAAPDKFGPHYSVQRSLLNPMGATPQAAAGADFCYRCHSKSTDTNPGGGAAKAVSGKDYFGSKTMVASSEDIFTTFTGTPAGGATTATNTLYFMPVAQETATGTLPTAHLSTTDTFAGGTFVARSMSPYAPTAANEAQDVVNNTVTAATQNWQRVSFISPLVATGFTTTAAAWTINVYDRESSANANARARYAIYTIDSTGALKSSIVARANGGTEMGTTTAPGTMQTITTAAGSAVAVAAGDRIVVDLEIQTVTVTTAGSYQMTYYFGSTAQSNVVMPSTATFTYANRGTTPQGRHNVASYKGLHKDDETLATISVNKHVECTDCHDPHLAKSGTHTAGSATLAGVLTGAAGVTTPSTWPANWTAPTQTAYAPGGVITNALSNAAAEWQICFKCHSGANSNVASWGGTGAAAFTDLGLEFNPNNGSAHPIVVPLNSQTGSLGTKALTAAQMVAPWTNVGTQIMTCTDCHATDSTASKGPHGSAVKWMLAGTNKAWPYTTAAGNGGSTGTFFRLATYNSGAGSNNGLFCLNCHTIRPATGGNSWHTNGNTTGGQHGGDNMMACVSCHIRVPHGGKISRLLQTANAPARYRGDGNGTYATGSGGAYLDSWGPNATGGIKGSAVSSANFNVSCSTHNSGAGEAW